MTRNNVLIIFAILLLSISACVPHSKMVYLQQQGEIQDTLKFSRPEYYIKAGDILHVRVLTMEEESFLMFNNVENRGSTSYSTRENQISVYLHGYNVSDNGNITLPVIGKVEVAGLTTERAQDKIQEKIDKYLIGATVVVKIANFSVTVLGEVKRPGNYYVYDNRFTVMDVLGMAGDMTEFGNRQVNIVRQTEDGAVFSVLDITDSQAVTSEFYYLQPDDLVYVQPHRVKRLGFREFPFSVLFSAITTTILLLGFIR